MPSATRLQVDTVRLNDVCRTMFSIVEPRQSTSRSSGEVSTSVGMHGPFLRTKKGSMPGCEAAGTRAINCAVFLMSLSGVLLSMRGRTYPVADERAY